MSSVDLLVDDESVVLSDTRLPGVA
jgi:hypothetical protein